MCRKQIFKIQKYLRICKKCIGKVVQKLRGDNLIKSASIFEKTLQLCTSTNYFELFVSTEVIQNKQKSFSFCFVYIVNLHFSRFQPFQSKIQNLSSQKILIYPVKRPPNFPKRIKTKHFDSFIPLPMPTNKLLLSKCFR